MGCKNDGTNSEERRLPEGKRRARVVVADDNAPFLDRIVDLLETRFEVVGRATSSEELLHVVEGVLPNVVVTDIEMPTFNGLEAARLIRRKYPLMSVVVLSADSAPEVVAAAFAAGASAFVSKSDAYIELIPVIENTLAEPSS
jgi:DNA-binding NarL/FixJ family response regulator